jgi:segregation and condensation protein A
MVGRASDPACSPADEGETSPIESTAAGEGEGRTPVLALEGFTGPLERLLILARAQQVDLARISVGELVDQLTAALHQAPSTTPLGQKGDWVVMASWLLELRSRLLLPVDPAAQQEAELEADQLRERLVGLQAMQALAGWLDRRPQPGRDVFVRGAPEFIGSSIETAYEVDVIEFLWASLALFDDDIPGVDTTDRYRPRRFDLHAVPDARARIMRLLAEHPAGHRLDALLPEAADSGPLLRRRSAWASTFVASLELAKQGEIVLRQENPLGTIHVKPSTVQGSG